MSKEALAMSRTLVRMVLRISPDLGDVFHEINDRLFAETRVNYSYAAIIRGLIALGLSSLRDKESLADAFAGARIPRGRKPTGAAPSARAGAVGVHGQRIAIHSAR